MSCLPPGRGTHLRVFLPSGGQQKPALSPPHWQIPSLPPSPLGALFMGTYRSLGLCPSTGQGRRLAQGMQHGALPLELRSPALSQRQGQWPRGPEATEPSGSPPPPSSALPRATGLCPASPPRHASRGSGSWLTWMPWARGDLEGQRFWSPAPGTWKDSSSGPPNSSASLPALLRASSQSSGAGHTPAALAAGTERWRGDVEHPRVPGRHAKGAAGSVLVEPQRTPVRGERWGHAGLRASTGPGAPAVWACPPAPGGGPVTPKPPCACACTGVCAACGRTQAGLRKLPRRHRGPGQKRPRSLVISPACPQGASLASWGPGVGAVSWVVEALHVVTLPSPAASWMGSGGPAWARSPSHWASQPSASPAPSGLPPSGPWDLSASCPPGPPPATSPVTPPSIGLLRAVVTPSGPVRTFWTPGPPSPA